MTDQQKTHKIGIIMNGVTGRMGKNQHLLRSIVPIIGQGGVKISEHEVIMPQPVLAGRNATKLEQLAAESGIDNWTTDLDSVLSDDDYQIYFDAQRTDLRVEIKSGSHGDRATITLRTRSAADGIDLSGWTAGAPWGVDTVTGEPVHVPLGRRMLVAGTSGSGSTTSGSSGQAVNSRARMGTSASTSGLLEPRDMRSTSIVRALPHMRGASVSGAWTSSYYGNS
jgi:hypothetical protein